MKRLVSVCLLACALVDSAPLLAAGPGGDGLHTVDVAWTKAMLANDPAACAALYADDAVLVLPGSGAIKGKKAILEAYTGWLKEVKVTEAVVSDAQYRSAGDISSGWGTWKVTTVKKGGGAPVTEMGRWTAVAVKKDGAWKYAADHASADPAPAK